MRARSDLRGVLNSPYGRHVLYGAWHAFVMVLNLRDLSLEAFLPEALSIFVLAESHPRRVGCLDKSKPCC